MPALEALAHGCPIIHPYPSGIWDLAQDCVHGFKVKHDEPQDFINRLDQLVHDDELARKMGERGIELARRNTWRKHNQKLEAGLKEL